MSGASARYSCFCTPVETSTPPSGRPKAAGTALSAGCRGLYLFRRGIIHALGVHSDPLHHLVLLGAVVPVPLGGNNGVRRLHPLYHLAEGGVSAVQVGASATITKNWLPAESMLMARAMDSTPRVWSSPF